MSGRDLGGSAVKYSDLQALSDDELIYMHDQQARSAVVSVNYYLDELRRRQAAQQAAALIQQTEVLHRQNETLINISRTLQQVSKESGDRLERETRVLIRLTVLIATLTAVNVIAVVVPLFRH